jgi:hypothetical protein
MQQFSARTQRQEEAMELSINHKLHQPVPDDLDEECEPRIIRLRLEGLRMEGIARSFAAADKILLDWCARLQGNLRCGFEIVHADGRVQQGQYQFRTKGTGRPALERFLRQLALSGAIADDAGLLPQARSRDEAAADEPAQRVTRRRIRLPAYRADMAHR